MNQKIDLKLEEKIKSILIPKKAYAYYKRYKGLKNGEKEIHLLPHIVDPNRDSIDIGANKGVYTYCLSTLCNHVHAFEPNPTVNQFLKCRAPKNATVYSEALSNIEKKTIFRIPKTEGGRISHQGGTLVTENIKNSYLEVEVNTARLDYFNLKNIGFIKIDVEGHERSVIEGARNTIIRERPTLLVEIEESHTKRSISEDIAWIESMGYIAFALFGKKHLKNMDFFDPKIHHLKENSENYIYNFIFFPTAHRNMG